MAFFRKYGWIAWILLITDTLLLYLTDSRCLFHFLSFAPLEIFQQNYPRFGWLVWAVAKIHWPLLVGISLWYSLATVMNFKNGWREPFFLLSFFLEQLPPKYKPAIQSIYQKINSISGNYSVSLSTQFAISLFLVIVFSEWYFSLNDYSLDFFKQKLCIVHWLISALLLQLCIALFLSRNRLKELVTTFFTKKASSINIKEPSINFLLFIIATAISFLAFEIIARNFLTVGEAYPPSSVWALERWLELEQKSKTKAEVTRHSIDRYDSLYGWTTKSNLREFGQHQGWIVNSNSKGVRGCIEHAYGKHSRLRIVTIGDSFTFGECVNDSQTYPAQLNKRLPDAEVINLGVHGYGHDQQLLKLIHEGLKYQPDIIVLGYLQDDVYRNMVSFRDYAKPYFVLKNKKLELKNVPVPFPEYFTNQFHLKSIGLLRAKWAEVTATYNDPENELLSKAILDSMVTLAQKQYALFITVYLPWDVQIMENGAKPLPALFDSLCSRKGVVKVDPTQAFNQYLSGRTDTAGIFKCHYPPVFNNIIADLLAREIHNNNILKEHVE